MCIENIIIIGGKDLSEKTVIVNEEYENLETAEEKMLKELLNNDWDALESFIFSNFREFPNDDLTIVNIQTLKNILSEADNLPRVKANLSIASTYFEIFDTYSIIIGLMTILVTISGDIISEVIGNHYGLLTTLVMWLFLSFSIAQQIGKYKKGMRNIKYIDILIDAIHQQSKVEKQNIN